MQGNRSREGESLAWTTGTMRWLVILVLASGAVAAVGYHQMMAVNEEVAFELELESEHHRRVSSRTRFDVERGALLSATRDEILQAHPEMDASKGRELAELVVLASEKYPSVDPVLLASIGIVDSRQVSDPGSGSFYRMHPAAARRLAEELGWEYDEELRADPVKTVELAARHLDRLNRAYNDVEMILAEYNGGPLNAGYLRARVGRLSQETKTYVPQVLDVYARLASRLAAADPDGERPRPVEERKARTLADAAGGG